MSTAHITVLSCLQLSGGTFAQRMLSASDLSDTAVSVSSRFKTSQSRQPTLTPSLASPGEEAGASSLSSAPQRASSTPTSHCSDNIQERISTHKYKYREVAISTLFPSEHRGL